jgi:hypothetical protein
MDGKGRDCFSFDKVKREIVKIVMSRICSIEIMITFSEKS